MMTANHYLWPALLEPERWNDPSLVAISAAGVRVTCADGASLLCGTSGLWNANLGYGNRRIVDAVCEATEYASYLGVFGSENRYAQQAAEALIAVAGRDRYRRVLLSTSGGAANDLVMKLSRHFQVLNGNPAKNVVVGLRNSYHGLTYGAFSVTGEELGQRLYSVDQRLIRHTAANDIDDLKTLLTRQHQLIAAVVVEPVLGNGTIALTDDYVTALLELRQQYGFLLVADEVATGFGRTGPMFATDSWPQAPDLLITSKGLTNGTCAAAAVLVAPGICRAFETPGVVFVHGETQAGTAISCAAILATLNEFDRLNALELGRNNAQKFDVELKVLAGEYPSIVQIPGTGMFRSVRIAGKDGHLDGQDVAALVAAIRAEGAIVYPGISGIQLIPALTYTDADIAELCGAIRRGLFSCGLAAHTRQVAS